MIEVVRIYGRAGRWQVLAPDRVYIGRGGKWGNPYKIGAPDPMAPWSLMDRDRVIELFAADVKKVTAALGPDYKVIVHGIDQPIEWVREGMLDVTIYVAYKYDVLPATISGYTNINE